VLQEQLFMAKQAYWDLYTASESLKVVSRTVHTLNDLADVSARRIGQGQGGRMEQLMDPMAKMESIGLQNQVLALAQERVEAQTKLEQLIGVTMPGYSDLEAGPLPDLSGLSQMTIEERAMDSRPGMLEAKHHLLHMKAQQKLALSGWMPDLMLQYSLIDNTGGPQTGMAMAKVNLPFIWFWRQGAEVRAADKEVEASEGMVRSSMLETSAMVESEWEMLKTARAQLENDTTVALPNAELALKLGLSGYKSGSVGVTDALNAVKSYLMTNLEAIGLTAQIRRSVAGLEALVGGSLDKKYELETSHESH
jgi:outer membrane protein TolC